MCRQSNTEAVNCHEFLLNVVELKQEEQVLSVRKPCCKLLLEVAGCCLEANFSGAQLDVKKIEEGHVCNGCFREVGRIAYCTCTKFGIKALRKFERHRQTQLINVY